MDPSFTLPREPAPRDFSARLRRSRVRSLRRAKAPRHYGRRALVLAATVALPAFAAPADWHFAIGNSGPAMTQLPFEDAGDGSSGTVFHYLAQEPTPPPFGEGVHGDAEPAPRQIDPLAGPAARALRIDSGGVDRARALRCLTTAIYYEAASEPDTGQRAIAQVVLNRVAHPAYPKTVCGVIYQGSEKTTGCQFSFACDGSLARMPNRMFWLRAENVARAALTGYVYAPIGLATHYHTVAVHPYWADKLSYIGTIGAHRFYRFGGPAGTPATFRFAYLGGEPPAEPHPRGSAPAAAELVADPVAIQRAYESGLRAAQANAYPPGHSADVIPLLTAPPAYPAERQRRGDDTQRTDNLPKSSEIRPEYQQSGRWIAQPD